MIKLALLCFLGALPVGCTGENVDEAFLATHGAVLARVTCENGVFSPAVGGINLTYDAVMFLDGSVLVSGTRDANETRFFERSDTDRVHARLRSGGYGSPPGACGGPTNYVEINSGVLEFYSCSGGSPASYVHHSAADRDLTTDCTGFNKHLFD